MSFGRNRLSFCKKRMSFCRDRLSFRGNRRMHQAALSSDNANIIVQLLDKGYKLDANTLHNAAGNGNLEVVKFVLNRKSSLLNSSTGEGCTALHLALDEKREEVCKHLIKRCADVNAVDKLGRTPLHYLCKSAFSLEILSLLHNRGAILDAVTKDEKSALHLLAEKMELAVELNQWRFCEFLLSRQCQVNRRDSKGWTPLHYAAHNGLFEVCRILLDYGAECIASADNERRTPLHLAVSKGHTDIMMLLLDNKAKVDAQDSLRWTPLHHAAKGGYIKMVEILVSTYNADPSLVDLKRRSTLYVAVSNNKHLVVSWLLNAAKVNDYHIDINATTLSRSTTALNRAVKLKNLKIVEILLDNGAYYNSLQKFGTLSNRWFMNRNDKSIKELRRSIDDLFYNAKRNAMKGVEMSVERGASVNARDHKSGRTALHFAVLADNLQMTEFLLGKGAKVHLTSNDGLTALSLALLKGKFRLAQTLIDHANKTLSTIEMARFLESKSLDEEWTALHLAAKYDLIDICQSLTKLGAVYNAKDARDHEPKNSAGWGIQSAYYFEAIDNLMKCANTGDTMKVLELLYQNPTIVNARNVVDGSTALYWTLYNNHTDTAKALLRYGANGRLTTYRGYTALHIACQRGNVDIIDDLMARYSGDEEFINFRTFDDKMSALHLASNIEVARKLLSNFACYNIKNSRGETPHDVTMNNEVKRLLETTESLLRKLQQRSPNEKERADHRLEDLIAIKKATEDQTTLSMRWRMKFQDCITELTRTFSSSVESMSASLGRRYSLQFVRWNTKL